ncbi:MAG: SpoIID/LytB domain-containing protein [Candidatus Omnitrophota bacterium]|nr:SpoIID/LytB domain-containing protein [Candidatus Omnitrophota bacterium]
MKKISALFLIILLSLSVMGADSQANKKNINPILRVLVIENKDNVLMVIKGGYRIYSIPSDKLLTGGYILHTVVSASDQGIMFGQRDLKFSKIRIVVPESAYIYIDGRAFRGSVDIVRKDNAKLMVINRVPLEEYLYGVLYNEVSHRWPIESIKAQAVTARTFALYQARQNKLQDYDLTNDIYSQVYSGATSERWATTRAVKLTAGKVLAYNGDIFPAYYHATCGGRTEDASSLWNIDLPCLKSVECSYCKESPHYKWTKIVLLKDLEKKLSGGGYKVGSIKKIEVLSRDNSGRADKVEIKDEADVSCILTAKDFRHMLGPNDVRSTNFEVSINGDKLVLKGIGWGHGVGMCQWGAKGQSDKKKKCEQILELYYPGAQITTIDKISGKL